MPTDESDHGGGSKEKAGPIESKANPSMIEIIASAVVAADFSPYDGDGVLIHSQSHRFSSTTVGGLPCFRVDGSDGCRPRQARHLAKINAYFGAVEIPDGVAAPLALDGANRAVTNALSRNASIGREGRKLTIQPTKRPTNRYLARFRVNSRICGHPPLPPHPPLLIFQGGVRVHCV